MAKTEPDMLLHVTEENGQQKLELRLPPLMTVAQLATFLQVGRSHAYNLIKTGQIPAIAAGERRTLVVTSDVLEWINARKGKTPPLALA